MASNMTSSDLRAILRNPLKKDVNRFDIIKEIASYIVSEPVVGQEFILRLLARIGEFSEFADIVDGMLRQVGLFPYLDKDKLSLKDTIAYGVHCPVGVENVVFHHAQAEIYYSLMRGENIILSAPTSFGKSLIIDSIIAAKIHNNIMVIVPTIALIDETRKRLSKYNNYYKIITHPSQTTTKRNVFLLTQERAIELISEIDVDFFIIDEFYKLSPQKSDEERSHILNQVFYSLVKKDAQFYLLGPNIEKVTTSLLDEIKYKFIRTDYKTVVSERYKVRSKDSETSIDRLVRLCKDLEEPTLIFCQSPASANKVANALLESQKFERHDLNQDLSEWLRENYHEEWILPKCLDYGIGIHHGKIPRAIAQSCVKLFNDERIKYLICTSTLIEGVNTKAKNVIIYDNKIARDKFDYFTFNNICGRSGRMFSYFIGRIYLFHDAPEARLPLVDFPIFTQSEDVPEKLLINIQDEDLKERSRKRLAKYLEQNLLTKETLQRNSYIDLDKQLSLATVINRNLPRIYHDLNWNTYPTSRQLKLACILIWDYLVASKGMVYGISSGKQLHFKINQFRKAGTIKEFLRINTINCTNSEEINSKIESAFDIQRHWINFQFPRYLSVLGDIVNNIFANKGYRQCDYSIYASLVECYFIAPYVVALDEYGLPIPISSKIGELVELSSNLDEALSQLKKISPKSTNLSSIEKDFLLEFQQYI